ncbi:MAG: cyclase family protein [Nitrospinaceae bacterium]|nr:cyclase family protein [Nitrospinaceae bacterium]NIR53354.1 cyclase family protein [Nitrospinaceae bacterium]NIS83754.1 cyclase family protein [Nitrospinaceae bacterium]NIT80553.1 cyclase family protein [Nitrospinaceae bacterium]NIU42878.1 cyclase family protein [Nitrospinaceae bacterium]
MSCSGNNSLARRSRMGWTAAIVFGLLETAALFGAPAVPGEPRWVDLTHPFDESTIYWPTSQPFRLEEVHKGPTKGGFWYEANNLSAAEHGGTHLDAPAHFAQGKWHVDDIPLDRLIAPGIRVDVRENARGNPDYRIRKEDFLAWEEKNRRIPEGSAVLVWTGWQSFWPDKKKYLGTAKRGDVEHLHFPGFSAEAARFLARERKVAAVGLDTASLDFGASRDFPAHRIFGEANIPGYENLHRLDQLPAQGFRVIALPMKIGDGSGAPLRIVAEVE